MNQRHDKQAVLNTGLNLFCVEGYHKLGVDEICKVTGMTKGAFYHAFKSKEHFLIETIMLYGEKNTQRIQAALCPNNHQTAFERLVQFYLNMLEAQPNVNFIGCYINNMMSELGTTNNSAREISYTIFNKFIDAIVPTVIEAQKNGEIRNDTDARQLSELIHSTFYGALTVAKSSHRHEQSITTIKTLFNNLKITEHEQNDNH